MGKRRPWFRGKVHYLAGGGTQNGWVQNGPRKGTIVKPGARKKNETGNNATESNTSKEGCLGETVKRNPKVRDRVRMAGPAGWRGRKLGQRVHLGGVTLGKS